jgi:predicted secreted hydrolase
VSPLRRALLLATLGAGTTGLPAGACAQVAPPATPPAPPPADPIRRGRTLVFPRDHGAHLTARTEWWYATGWLGTPQAPVAGFQVTFFRSRTGLAQDSRSRFAARHLLFAHAAVTQLGGQRGTPGGARHLHDQRIVRWSGDGAAATASARVDDADVHIGTWRLHREDQSWVADVPAQDFRLQLTMQRTQPLLLQGDAGFSRKGPEERQASHYYSEPQLATRSVGTLAGAAGAGHPSGIAWLDHEWSDEILHPQAVGWDWIGMNLFDGSALTAFVLRRQDGSTLWAGGSWRAAGQPAQAFAPEQVRFEPGRLWVSPGSGTRYPVQWQVDTPAGRFEVRALMDAQELDSRGSTGSIYWEGLSELLDAQGRRVGLGYLEMTGYAAPLRMQ